MVPRLVSIRIRTLSGRFFGTGGSKDDRPTAAFAAALVAGAAWLADGAPPQPAIARSGRKSRARIMSAALAPGRIEQEGVDAEASQDRIRGKVGAGGNGGAMEAVAAIDERAVRPRLV